MLKQKDITNAIRFLAVDAIQRANSGHPGMPLGMADIATVLWREFLRHSPVNPRWLNRDRFVLSNGHGSMLLYALLHLTGYDLSLDDLKNFRQLHSKTPGHPEIDRTPGIETTTGPLGQGLANGVGIAFAEKVLAAQFNRPQFSVVDHYTYVFAGDGCLMEGISHEAASFAGTHRLGKLILFWDDNKISIDGSTDGWFTEDVRKRFHSYGWHVVADVDGHDQNAVRQAIEKARAVTDQPSIICCKTIIGFGAPNLCNTHSCHGAPLGAEEIAAMRNNLEWPHVPFVIPEEIYNNWDAKDKGKKWDSDWQKSIMFYHDKYPELAFELMRRWCGALPIDWKAGSSECLESVIARSECLATRKASQKALNTYGPLVPELLGGSADLTPSNLTNWHGTQDITPDSYSGNYIHYGVREFGMFAIANGISLHGGFIPYVGTFLVFASYGHSAIRMAAMMKRQVVYVFTHDSIGLGEDGPTHQPVEQLAMLRATPGLSVWRPCDDVETAVAWQYAIERQDGPTALILSRQKLPTQITDDHTFNAVKNGWYVLIDTETTPDCILIASGSEVRLACTVANKLNGQGHRIRVVSVPAQDLFDKQDESYKELVLPQVVTKRIAIEASASQSWYKYVGLSGKVIGLDRYGESAPEGELFEFFGFTEQEITKVILSY